MSSLLVTAPLLGLIAMAMSLSYLLPIAVSIIYGDGAVRIFGLSMLINFACGFMLWLPTRRHKKEITARDSILLVALVWSGGALLASMPLLLALPGLSFTDAYFEAMSGLTTTGATVLSGLDALLEGLKRHHPAVEVKGAKRRILFEARDDVVQEPYETRQERHPTPVPLAIPVGMEDEMERQRRPAHVAAANRCRASPVRRKTVHSSIGTAPSDL